MCPHAKQLPSLADRNWLHSPALCSVFSLLGGRNEVRVVGGAVRNSLLGEEIGDVDLATIHSADEIMRRAEGADIKTVATGGEHGTVSLVVCVDDVNYVYEVTPLRIDVETDGRHAVVASTQNWALDAQRRDFYINALYCDEAGQIYDFVGGYEDVLARRVRFIGSAHMRIEEDYLRILRFFRFSALYANGKLDAEGLAACIALKDGMSRLSAERIKHEVFKLLVAPFALEVVTRMVETGIMEKTLPGPVDLACFTNLISNEREMGQKPNALRRLAALAGVNAACMELWSGVLRLSKKESLFLVEAGRQTSAFSTDLAEAAQKALLYKLGSRKYQEFAVLAWSLAGHNADKSAWKKLINLPQRWQVPEFTPSGADVLALGVASGPKVGQILSQLEQEWIDAGFAWDTSEFEARLKMIIEKT